MMLETVPDTVGSDLASHVLRSSRIESIPWLQHGITSRVAHGGSGEGNVGYSPPRDRRAAWRNRQHWCRAIEVDHTRLVTVSQVHGSAVFVADRAHCGTGAAPESGPAGHADALITNLPDVPLMTLHADCQPILFVDPARKVIGVAHAGWRGVVADVAGATVHAMSSAFGSAPCDIWAYLGPAIGVECYEVGHEVAEAWESAVGPGIAREAVRLGEPRPYFDLTGANRLLLNRAGVPSSNIESSEICTACSGTSWFSHRSQGPATGRFGAIMSIGE